MRLFRHHHCLSGQSLLLPLQHPRPSMVKSAIRHHNNQIVKFMMICSGFWHYSSGAKRTIPDNSLTARSSGGYPHACASPYANSYDDTNARTNAYTI